MLRFTADCFLWPKYDDIRPNHTKKNIPRIGKLPYGAKRGFIERKALLKKGFIERKALLMKGFIDRKALLKKGFIEIKALLK